MRSAYSEAGLVAINNQVYLVGGQSNSSCLNSVDIYDIQTDRWTPGIPMSEKRRSANVAVLNEMIYAVNARNTFDFLTQFVFSGDLIVILFSILLINRSVATTSLL